MLSIMIVLCPHTVAANGLALGEEADFEAQNCKPSTKFDTR